MEFKKIDVAFDGSKDSVKAVEAAADLAARFNADLTVVHVYARPVWIYAGYPGIPPPNLDEIEAMATIAAQKLLDKGVSVATEHGAKAKGELIEAPSVAQALIEFAEDEKADLIVVGSRGITGFKKIVMGSVSSGLVTHAECPVLVVR